MSVLAALDSSRSVSKEGDIKATKLMTLSRCAIPDRKALEMGSTV